MTRALKAQILFKILELAFLPGQKERFEKHQDADELWRHYTNSLKSRPGVDEGLESTGKISFRMLEPAMKAVHDLRTID